MLINVFFQVIIHLPQCNIAMFIIMKLCRSTKVSINCPPVDNSEPFTWQEALLINRTFHQLVERSWFASKLISEKTIDTPSSLCGRLFCDIRSKQSWWYANSRKIVLHTTNCCQTIISPIISLSSSSILVIVNQTLGHSNNLLAIKQQLLELFNRWSMLTVITMIYGHLFSNLIYYDNLNQ